MAFPTKKSILDNFPLCPSRPPPPENRKFYFYCRLAFSDRGVLRRSAGFFGGFRGSDPMLVTLGNCWRGSRPPVHQTTFNTGSLSSVSCGPSEQASGPQTQRQHNKTKLDNALPKSFCSFLALSDMKQTGAELKADAPKVTGAQSCGFLRFSAITFDFLRKSAVSCALQMLEFPGEGVKLRKSAVFCDNLRFGLSLCHLSSVPLSAPRQN